MKTANGYLIPGDIFEGHYVLRSIDWETRRATFENLEADILDFRNRWHTRGFYTLPVDKLFIKDHLGKLLDYALTTRTKGRHKVSKDCVKRIQTQLQAVQ